MSKKDRYHWPINRNMHLVFRPNSERLVSPVNELNRLADELIELKEYVHHYTEAVAEICDEDKFQEIEAEYNLRAGII